MPDPVAQPTMTVQSTAVPQPVMPMPDPVVQPTMTVAETCEVLRISRDSAYRAAREGDLPVIRLGRRMLVPTAALRRMLGIDPPA